MTKILIALAVIVIVLWTLLATRPAHAQQGPGDVTPGDVAALQAAASTAATQLSSAQAGLAAAQAQYSASQEKATQAKALADQAAQKLQLQQTVQAVELATQAKALADQADADRKQAGLTLQAAQGQVDGALSNLQILTDALAKAQAGNARRDSTIAQRDAALADQAGMIALLTMQVNDMRQQREQINTLIVLLAFDVIVMVITALFVFRKLQALRNPVTIIEERGQGQAPLAAERAGVMDSRLPDDVPDIVTDRSTLDRIHGIFQGEAM